MPWAKVGLVAVLTLWAGWGVLELGQRYLGLQKLTIERVSVVGCRGERLAEVQALADRFCMGKPLFWFDADGLRRRVEELRWVRGLLIRRDPPDRVSLVIEERKPILWVVKEGGVFLLSDDGIVLDRLGQSNLQPIPVVADPGSLSDESVVSLIRAASRLRDRQPDFFVRLVELRWTARGPVAFMEGVQAPLYLSRQDPDKNVPNFQGLYLEKYANGADLGRVRYFDLRWDNEIAVGEMQETEPPKATAK